MYFIIYVLIFGRIRPILVPVNGNEFIKKVKKIGKDNNVAVSLNSERGKGSHITLYYGDKFTVVKDRKKEIGKGLYKAMMNQLGINE